jgi:hypothetical protein
MEPVRELWIERCVNTGRAVDKPQVQVARASLPVIPDMMMASPTGLAAEPAVQNNMTECMGRRPVFSARQDWAEKPGCSLTLRFPDADRGSGQFRDSAPASVGYVVYVVELVSF